MDPPHLVQRVSNLKDTAGNSINDTVKQVMCVDVSRNTESVCACVCLCVRERTR